MRLAASIGARLCSPNATAFAALGAVLFYAAAAYAQRVILVCPPEADPVLSEAFNRLRGELTMHGFEVEIQTAEGAISPEALAQHAERSQAVASVSFVRNEAGATADIKISDRVTGKTSIRTIATPASTDSPSLLALRAVELLRASLREFGPKTEPPKDIVGASPNRENDTVTEWAEGKKPETPATVDEPPVLPPIASPVEVSHHVTMRADIVGLMHLADASGAYGFGGALGLTFGPHFEGRLVFESPWYGARYRTARAEAQFHLWTAFAEATYAIALSPQLQLEPLLGFGIARATTYTATILPVTLHTPAPSAWVAMFNAGLGLNVALTPRVFWTTAVRIGTLAPHPIVVVESQRHKLGAPMILGTSGIGLKF